jgi:RNA polymerase sigma-70 factor (ECF subfamily)
MEAYWKPLYAYLRSEHSPEDSEDLLQQFYQDCLETQILEKADPARGRFRSYLLTCLRNSAAKARRFDHAKRREPIGGLVSVEDLIANSGSALEPSSNETPEAAYHRVWSQNLIHRVLHQYATQCLDARLDIRYELFRLRIVEPSLHGTPTPSYASLGTRFRLTENAANKAVLKAKSEFLQLLEREIRGFSGTEGEFRDELESVLGQIRDDNSGFSEIRQLV